MKKDIDEQIRETVPDDLRARVLQRAEPSLERNRRREGSAESSPWWASLFSPLALGGLATAGAAAAVIIVLSQHKADTPVAALGAAEYDLEMLAEAELLQDLEVLDKWEELRKAWKPKKT